MVGSSARGALSTGLSQVPRTLNDVPGDRTIDIARGAVDGDVVARTNGLTMRFGPVTALEDLDDDRARGHRARRRQRRGGVDVIKILLGLAPSGRPRPRGRCWPRHREPGRADRRPGPAMPEHDCLPPTSVGDFVVHLGTMPKVADRRPRWAADVLRHVGLAEERYRPMGGYSTGMKQRAKLAQALVHDPRLVLLDQVDRTARRAEDMLGLVRRIGHHRISVLVTSHLLGELERVSDHVVVLDGGRLLRSSATGEFLEGTGDSLVEVLGGTPERDTMVAAPS